MKQLFVNGQVFQTGALERGMGILTLELLRTVTRQSNDIGITILLNKRLKTSTHHNDRMNVLLHGLTTEWIDLPNPEDGTPDEARETIENYLQSRAGDLSDTYFLEPAMFLFDYHALVPRNCTSVIFFHDLIPLIRWEDLKNVFPGHVYFDRFHLLDEADLILANSENTRNELVELLGIDARRIIHLNFSAESFDLTAQRADEIVAGLGVNREFILLPTGGGFMAHKNNTVAAQALGLAARNSNLGVLVVATSKYEEFEKLKLLTYFKDIIFTGSVEHEAMQALYMKARAILMPSLAEGLGIPLMNGVRLNKPIVSSDIPVFAEIAGTEDIFYEFAATDPFSASGALLDALAGVNWSSKSKGYKKVNERYTWQKTGEQFIAALESVAPADNPVAKRVALTFIAPDPLTDKHVGYRAQAVASVMRHDADIKYFIDAGTEPVGYEQRGADYIRFLTDTYDLAHIEKYHALGDPAVIFLNNSDQYPMLNITARAIKGNILYLKGRPTPELYATLKSQKFIDEAMSAYEQAQLAEDEYGAPSLLTIARAIIAEEPLKPLLEKTIKNLGVDPPRLYVSEGHDSLYEYAQGDDRDAVRSIVAFIKENI